MQHLISSFVFFIMKDSSILDVSTAMPLILLPLDPCEKLQSFNVRISI